VIAVHHDDENGLLYTADKSLRRVTITSSRAALNGYQKGKCFYCFDNLTLAAFTASGTDVDHFFPHRLKQVLFSNLDGVWNLVLSCYACNRGEGGKFSRIPEMRFLERLHKRNEFIVLQAYAEGRSSFMIDKVTPNCSRLPTTLNPRFR